MSGEEGVMGKLILLERAREEAAREALARAGEEEDRARAAEREAGERRRAAAEAVAAAGREPPAEAHAAQILQFRSRARRQLEEMLVAIELRYAELAGKRVSAEQARQRIRERWEAAQARREKLEERRRLARARARKRRDDAAEREQDDRPVRPDDDG